MMSSAVRPPRLSGVHRSASSLPPAPPRAAAVVVSIAGAIGARTVAHGFSRGNAGSFFFEPASAGDRQGQPSVGPLPPAEAGLDELNRPASPRLKPWATALNRYAVTARRSVHLPLHRRKRRLHAQRERSYGETLRFPNRRSMLKRMCRS